MITLAVLSACTALCTQAQGNETYTFEQTYPGAKVPFVANFVLTDAQVATGAFTLMGGGNNGPNPVYTGDVNGFISLRFSVDLVTPTSAFGQLRTFDLAFNKAGGLETVSADWYGQDSRVVIAGTQASATASFLDDDPDICPNSFNGTPGGRCTLTAPFSHGGDPLSAPVPALVPEPAAFALLGAGLIGLASLRRRDA